MAALTAMLTFAANAQESIYTVRTSAMEPTLLEGGHVLAPGGEQIRDLRRGDVIVFHFPPDPNAVHIKRLIGLPGDHIRIRGGVLVLNSKSTMEPYVVHLAGPNASPFLSNFPSLADKESVITPDGQKMLERNVKSDELVIPPGAYFVLGDNRDYSYDSRLWGFVDASQIIGLAREIVSSDDPKTKAPRPGRNHIPIQRSSPK